MIWADKDGDMFSCLIIRVGVFVLCVSDGNHIVKSDNHAVMLLFYGFSRFKNVTSTLLSGMNIWLVSLSLQSL